MRFIVGIGLVSLFADIVYEGARSITGPYLAALGASTAAVGVITGAGEAVALLGRLGSGRLVDRTRAYWPLMIGGYVMTIVAVPLLGLTSVLWIAAGLVIAERGGKAIRRPAKDVILSYATSSIGRGRGFAVHEALDQTGAVVGPLLVAAGLAITGRYAPTLGLLLIPGLIALVILLRLRRRVPDPSVYEPSASRPRVGAAPARGRLGSSFWWYSAFSVATMAGFSTFAVFAVHLVDRGMLSAPMVPLLYAAVMAVDALAALAAGALFDRRGRGILVVVPLMAAAIPPLAFSTRLPLAITGVLVWGIVLGLQESVMRASIADLVPTERRGTAYGVFAAMLGVAALAGGALTGALYDVSIPLLIGVVATLQAVALAIFFASARGRLKSS